MNIKNDLITAYAAGYRAAKYDMNHNCVIDGFKKIINDGKEWLRSMLFTGAIRLETNIDILKGRGNNE